jgi:hypothetical protein
MSRSRKTRSTKGRARTGPRTPARPRPARRPTPRASPAAVGPEEFLGGGPKRVDLARRRARVAKGLFGTGGAIVFGAAMIFARHSFAGHAKSPAHPLVAPPRFVRIVRKNLLQAGIVAPAQAPPGASTSVS